ncbi:MAG: LptA/OstA family protein [Steroidobacteraceae bacterium]
MASSNLSSILLLIAAGSVAAAQSPAQLDGNAPFDISARSTSLDYGANVLIFHDVVISQNDVHIEASEARASGDMYENSEWQLSGGVHIRAEGGRLESRDAKVRIVGRRVASASISGTPAQFEQQLRDRSQLARGRANRIEYDLANGAIRLAGDAWLTDGRNEISGRELIYDLRAQRVNANAQDADDRVRITIRPESKP